MLRLFRSFSIKGFCVKQKEFIFFLLPFLPYFYTRVCVDISVVYILKTFTIKTQVNKKGMSIQPCVLTKITFRIIREKVSEKRRQKIKK